MSLRRRKGLNPVSEKKQAENAAAGIVPYNTFSGTTKDKGKPKPKAKKPKRSGVKTGLVPLNVLMKETDRLATAYVFATLGRRCLLAGLDGHECSGVMTPAHILPRTKRHIRHDPANILPVCLAHHQRYEKKPEWRPLVLRATGDPFRVVKMELRYAKVKAQYGDNLRPVYETWNATLARALAEMAGQGEFDMEAA